MPTNLLTPSAQEEIAAEIASRTKRFSHGTMGSLQVYADLAQTPADKIVRGRLDDFLTAKAESRQKTCWMADCDRDASIWVREVRYDLGEKSGPLEKALVDTSHYAGSVPGFCFAHQHAGSGELATKVYFDMPPMAWGFRPSRFFVIFTDGSMTGGDAIELNPNPGYQPVVTDEHKVAV